jgi:hypothetical protein
VKKRTYSLIVTHHEIGTLSSSLVVNNFHWLSYVAPSFTKELTLVYNFRDKWFHTLSEITTYDPSFVHKPILTGRGHLHSKNTTMEKIKSRYDNFLNVVSHTGTLGNIVTMYSINKRDGVEFGALSHYVTDADIESDENPLVVYSMQKLPNSFDCAMRLVAQHPSVLLREIHDG